MPERMPAIRAVDLCGLDQVSGYGLQPRDIDDHHISDLLPRHQDDQAPVAISRAEHDRGTVVREDAVEDHRPDIAEHDTADQVWHEEDRAEGVGALDSARERIGNGEREHVDHNQRYNRDKRRVLERMHEGCVLKSFDVVAQADPTGVARGRKLTEGQVNTLEERILENI